MKKDAQGRGEIAASERVKESSKPKKSKPLVLPVHRRYAVCGRSSVQRLLAQPPSEQIATALRPLCVVSVSFPSSEHVKQSPKQKTRTPRAAAPAAACVAGRSRGQHMLPQQPSKQTATAPPTKPKRALCRSQAPLGNASREAPLRIPAPGTNTAPAARRAGRLVCRHRAHLAGNGFVGGLLD